MAPSNTSSRNGASRNRGRRNGQTESTNSNLAPNAPVQAPNTTQPSAQEAMIQQLQAQLEEVRAAARAAQEAATQARAGSSAPRSGITAIQRPAGTAGRDFNIQKAMGLKDNKELYLGIQQTVKHAAIQSGIDLHLPFRKIPVDKLASIYKKARDVHEYLDRRRFPADWPTVELLKQFLKNHRKHDRKMGRLESPSHQSNRGNRSSLPNIDEELDD